MKIVFYVRKIFCGFISFKAIEKCYRMLKYRDIKEAEKPSIGK